MRTLATGVVWTAVVSVLGTMACGAPTAAEIEAARKAAVRKVADAAAVDAARKELADVEARPAGFAIGVVTPEQLSISDDYLGAQTLTVAFSISDPATVTKAELKLYVGELGDVATQSVTAAEHGSAAFAIDQSVLPVGPTIRFRAVCPTGTTDWFLMGQIPYDYAERMTNVFRIARVSPEGIEFKPMMTEVQQNSGQRVSIFGPALPPGCTIDAQANGSPIEFNNLSYVNKTYEGLLMYRDFKFQTVSPRYGELKLLITRSNGQRLETVKRIAFEGQ